MASQKKTPKAPKVTAEENAGKIQQLAERLERFDDLVQQNQELRAEVKVLREHAKQSHPNPRLSHDETMAKVRRIREASRMKRLEGRYHWKFFQIIPGQFDEQGKPKLMPRALEFWTDESEKVGAVYAYNKFMLANLAPEMIVAECVDLKPELDNKQAEFEEDSEVAIGI